ncbi:MAG: glycoside hydrolase family 1 protein [Candidatus Abyssobacteria bacterium SURF_17]|uniref:Glycoside hydrolase family 1 protein n=1 Tax=Candidatus Abyssobacteria bacterium SURF_17 TaxID=2093361 RepID=A0A419EWW7_9BACT|nr:MAG: glycoside hydrolase family 1 protein [Candidatus Abyssubacteria bacterium SURF_17]
MNAGKTLEFPKGFLWGTATAAHQVEGGNRNNDWWEWEHRRGTIADGTTSESACDQYNRYNEDFDLVKGFGHNAHRLSLEWSRIEPKEGVFSSAELAHYRRVLEALHSRGIEPMLTLHHFTNPLWLAKMGGWENPRVVEYFTRYAKVVASELGSLVRFWVTINEPTVYTYMSYIQGVWPPGAKRIRSAAIVMTNLLRAHALAYHVIHEASPGPGCSVGIAKHIRILDPLRPGRVCDRAVARLSDFVFNRWFLDAIETGRLAWPIGMGQKVQLLSATQDFIGLNYYTREMTRFSLSKPQRLFIENLTRPGCATNDLRWEIYPEGFYRALMDLKKYARPIYVTENGCATPDDALRRSYLRDHLVQLHRAISAGADVRGYFHWSLIDNFEWAEGLGRKLGLVAVDYATQARAPRPSAWVYAKIAQGNKLDPAWFE